MLVDLRDAAMAQLVEHILGKDEVPSSNLGSSSKKSTCGCRCFLVCPPSACRRRISDLRFGERSARRPVRHCARIFAGLCTAVVILDCRREGICTLSFIIINHKLRVTAGRLCLRVCAFAAVCGISSVRGFFIYRRAARISPEMRNFAGIVFLPGGTLAHGAPLIRRKIFPRRCALSGEGVFPTDFPFGSRGAKMRSSKLRKTTHFASLREN